jgi:hypothetical protein
MERHAQALAFPSGATLAFGYLETDADTYRYQSAEFQLIGFDELTEFTEAQYTYLFSRLRRPSEGPLAEVPLRMCAASNPGGIGGGGRFIVSPEFPVPPYWHRWEFMDNGISNPAAWYIAATDEAGHVVVFDSYYSPGLISAHCEAVLERRSAWWPEYRDADGVLVRPSPRTWADPSVRNRTGQSPLTAKFQPETIASEYAKQSDGRISLALANNDPKEGRARVSELLKLEVGWPAPYYAPHLEGAPATPRLYVVRSRCRELAQQLEDAPLLPIDSGRQGAGEIVDPAWESRHGHGVAALRYGIMGAREATPPEDDDPLDPRRVLPDPGTLARPLGECSPPPRMRAKAS